ncbi:hypothetical protein [Streptomyces sp. URMC 129]|uniref:hypothetical protein n=1 Tax=Streptomyces sp. URMC 129 TaxID=3423407 RepID=UPI003F1E09C3
MSGDEEEFPDAANWSPINSREWYAARDAVAALRDVLITARLDREFPYLRADLNAFGQGMIDLGRISPETAQRLAELLRLAISASPSLQEAGRQDDSEPHDAK